MIAEAIAKVLTLAPVQELELNGLPYTDKSVHPVKEPMPDLVTVRSLSGLRDLLSNKIEELQPANYLVHVQDHKTVVVKALVSDRWGRRTELVKAINEEENRFSFNQYIDHEAFVIGLMANFTSTGDREYLLKIATNLSSEQVATSEDDGISQRVGLKAGVVLKSQETLRSRVNLAPFRTFREADQPASEFVFRVSNNSGGVPKCALFEADGGKWKLDAMANIAFWLKNCGVTLPLIY